jgi:ribosomal protein L22
MTEDEQDKSSEQDKPKRRRRTRAKADDDKAAAKPARRTRAKAKPKDEKAPEGEGKETAPPAEEPDPAEAEEKTAQPKPARRRRSADTPAAPPLVRARARYVRSSPRKARLVCEHIRGKSVEEARAILRYTPRAAARDWSKLLESAIANAEHNHELVGDDLRIDEAYADEGPTLKRYRPRAMGRATRINKRTTHLTITLTPKAGPDGPRRR